MEKLKISLGSKKMQESLVSILESRASYDVIIIDASAIIEVPSFTTYSDQLECDNPLYVFLYPVLKEIDRNKWKIKKHNSNYWDFGSLINNVTEDQDDPLDICKIGENSSVIIAAPQQPRPGDTASMARHLLNSEGADKDIVLTALALKDSNIAPTIVTRDFMIKVTCCVVGLNVKFVKSSEELLADDIESDST